MDLSTKIAFVLGLHLKPSEKTGLITLILADKPVTTVEINAALNCFKTFENYKVLFADHIDSGLVQIVSQKDIRGTTRNHFCIDNDVLETLIEENI